MLGRMNILEAPGALAQVGHGLLGDMGRVVVKHHADDGYLEGEARRLWVHITTTPDNRSRKIVRKLIALGFEFWPGKGYWR